MSLTRLLRDNEALADRLARLVPNNTTIRLETKDMVTDLSLRLWADLSRAMPMVAPPETDHYALVGTAFDYLMRFEIGRANPKSVEDAWVADQAVAIMQQFVQEHVSDDGETMDPSAIPSLAVLANYQMALGRCHGVIHGYRSWRGPYLDVPVHVKRAIQQASLTMAKMDTFYRTGAIEPRLEAHDSGDGVDLAQLAHIVPAKALGAEPGPTALLNPSFGKLTKLFNGADADLIVGDVLIDFKTTMYLDIGKHFAQLVGYCMIAEEFHDEENDAFPVLRRAGIYFARHGLLATFDTEPIRSNPEYGRAWTALREKAASLHKEGAGFV